MDSAKPESLLSVTMGVREQTGGSCVKIEVLPEKEHRGCRLRVR